MLQKMQQSGATEAQINSKTTVSKLDNKQDHVEENIQTLLSLVQKIGKKVKITSEEEEAH